MQMAIDIAADSGVPLQEQVVSKTVTLIRTGRLRPGARLPGTRELSQQLGVSRNTVIAAYARLAAEGYVQTREGAGTFVSNTLPDRSLPVREGPAGPRATAASTRDRRSALPPYKRPSGTLEWDFQLETIDPETFPSRAWRRLLLRRTQSATFSMTRYGAPNGLPELRECIAAHLGATRGMQVDPEQMLIVTGIQQALNVVGRLFVRPGTPLVMEAPGCRSTATLFKHYGAHVVPVPVDRHGLMVRDLPAAFGGLAFVTPARQFPLGATLKPDRRQALLDWARRGDCHVLEVDFDSEFHYEGPPPRALRAIDPHDRVIHAGSFATSIGPGLRIGYLVLPQRWVGPAMDALSLLDFGFPCHGVPWLDQAVLTDFIGSGGFEAHLRRVRRLYMSRRDQLVASLGRHFPRSSLGGTGSGTHLAWHLPGEFPSSVELQDLLRRHGVGVYTLQDRTVSDAEYLDTWTQVLLLGFASQTERHIDEGVRRIARLIG